MNMTTNHLVASTAIIICGILLNGAAAAQDNFYAGKAISLVVGSTAGGGQDNYGRLLARHLGRNIPGNPNIVVQNMPGAGSLSAVVAMDNTLPKDGTTIVTFNAGLVLSSIATPDKVRANFSDVAWLGSSGQELRICYMSAISGVKTWDELLKKDPVIMGDIGAGGSGSYIYQKILQQVFGVNLKQVLGYPGTAEKRLAVERGELDGECTNWTSVPADWVRDKKINLVIRFQNQTPNGFPENVPYGGGLVKDPEKKKLLDLFNSSSEIARPFIVSKAVPTDRLKLLREAFERTMKDPQYIADAEKQRMEVSPTPGAAVETMLKELTNTPPAVIAAARELLGE